MKIIIDGDSLPWKDEIIALGQKYNIKVIVVTSVSHYSQNTNPYAEVIYVDNRPQEADIKIMNVARDNDIIITADIGLSFFFIGKKNFVVNPRGEIFVTESAISKIEVVHIQKKLRRSKTRVKIKGPRKYLKTDLNNLLKTLKKLILKYNKDLQFDTI